MSGQILRGCAGLIRSQSGFLSGVNACTGSTLISVSAGGAVVLGGRCFSSQNGGLLRSSEQEKPNFQSFGLGTESPFVFDETKEMNKILLEEKEAADKIVIDLSKYIENYDPNGK